MADKRGKSSSHLNLDRGAWGSRLNDNGGNQLAQSGDRLLVIVRAIKRSAV